MEIHSKYNSVIISIIEEKKKRKINSLFSSVLQFIFNICYCISTLFEYSLQRMQRTLQNSVYFGKNTKNYQKPRNKKKIFQNQQSNFQRIGSKAGLQPNASFEVINGLNSKKVWVEKNYKAKLRFLNLAIARHYILMQFSTLNCNLLLNEELAIITFSLVKK